VIYLMDTAGNTLAASNWRDPDSFIGKNYSIRPYFQQAIAGQTGRYIAEGITSHRVDYYLSRPVMIDGAVRGVVVVKISLAAVQKMAEQLWHRAQELLLVADSHGVVVLSPIAELMFRSMRPLAPTDQVGIESTRQYGSEIKPVRREVVEKLGERILRVEYDEIPGQGFLEKEYYLPELDLKIYLHVAASSYGAQVAQFTGMFSLAALLVFVVAIIIYQRGAYGTRLFEAAIRDPLTGLHSRLYMDDWGVAAIHSHDRDQSAGIGLVMLDLDNFKHINDTYGHLAGDEVLKKVGTIVSNAIRPDDLAVRFGGEEIAIFVRCPDQAVAVALAERICSRIEQSGFDSKLGRMLITVSGGVAYRAPGESLDALFGRADEKLYEAKAQGRNRICS